MDDLIGFLAAGCVIATFSMRSMLHLRLAGIMSNIAFIVYGLQLELLPIWGLHLTLLPINLYRLWDHLPRRSRRPPDIPTHQPTKTRKGWRIEKRMSHNGATPEYVVVSVTKPSTQKERQE
jgi:hypothetical protein